MLRIDKSNIFRDFLFNKVSQQRCLMGFKSDLHWGTVSNSSDSRAPIFSVPLVTKSLVYLFLILGIITSPISVDPFPVIFMVLSLVISDVFLVLLTIRSLAADESFLVNFIPFFYVGFWESRRSLFAIVFAELGFALCSWLDIFYCTSFYGQPSGHSWVNDWSSSSCATS